jgi:hypothetical protein
VFCFKCGYGNITHQNNDRAVMAAYGFSLKMSESECVAELMRLYQARVEGII